MSDAGLRSLAALVRAPAPSPARTAAFFARPELAEAALRAAPAHRLTAVLLAAAPGPWPERFEPARLELRAAHRLERVWMARVLAALEGCLRVLERAGVPVVSLKGPLLGMRLYGSYERRPCTDLDLLVRDADLPRAMEALGAAGFVSTEGPGAREAREAHHHVLLERPHAPLVELHFRAHVGFGAVLRSEPLLERSVPVQTPNGVAARVLCPEDELLYLCTHAAAHAFELASWLYDVARLLEASPALDGAAVLARARSLGLLAPLGAALRAAGALFDPPAPPALRPLLRGTWSPPALLADRLAPRVRRRKDGSWREKALGLAFRALLCDSPARAAVLLATVARGNLALRRSKQNG